MNNIVVGNIVSLISSVFLCIGITRKDKNQFLGFKLVECAIGILANIILGGYTGAILNGAAMARAATIRKLGKPDWKYCWIFVVIAGLSIFTANSIEGVILVIGSAAYAFVEIQFKDTQKIRIALFLNLVCGLIYAMSIKNYVTAVTEIYLLCTTVVTFVIFLARRVNTEPEIIDNKE